MCSELEMIDEYRKLLAPVIHSPASWDTVNPPIVIIDHPKMHDKFPEHRVYASQIPVYMHKDKHVLVRDQTSLRCVGMHSLYLTAPESIGELVHEFLDNRAIYGYRLYPELLVHKVYEDGSIQDAVGKIINLFPMLGLLWVIKLVHHHTKDSPNRIGVSDIEAHPVLPIKKCVTCQGRGEESSTPFGICHSCLGTGTLSWKQYSALICGWRTLVVAPNHQTICSILERMHVEIM